VENGINQFTNGWKVVKWDWTYVGLFRIWHRKARDTIDLLILLEFSAEKTPNNPLCTRTQGYHGLYLLDGNEIIKIGNFLFIRSFSFLV